MKLFSKLGIFKKRIALIQDNKIYTYDDLINRSKKFSKIIKKNSLVILVAKNDIESIAFYVSSIINGYFLIILDENTNKEFFFRLTKNFKPNYIFYPKEYIVINNKNQKIFFSNYCLEKIDKKNKIINKKNSIILTTSGTTSNPKFVRLSNHNLFSNTEQIINYLKIKKKDITITTLPMAYSFGLSILNTHLEAGATVIINKDPIYSKNFWKKINDYNVCSFGTVPVAYQYLQKINFEKFIVNSLRYLTVAGGRTNKDTLKYLYKICKKRGIKFFVMYGQTEASPRMSYFDLTKYPKKIESIGKPLRNTKFEIYKNELIFTGDNVSLGYAKKLLDLKKGDENKGKIKTGDLGFKDNENFYFLTGRKKRISKLFGLRINLDDIENILKKNNLNVKAIINDNKIKIKSLNLDEQDKIKSIIFHKFKINKNYIEVINNINLEKKPNFKNLI